MEDQIFVLQTEDGKEQQCRVVFSFDSDEHSYVLFSLVGDTDTGISALRYEVDENGEMSSFSDIETDEEWAMVEEVMNTVIAEFGADQANFFTITNDQDEEVMCQILHRFEQGNKNYLFYAIFEDDAPNLDEVFASAYIAGEKGEVIDLLPIETDAEWEMIEEVLASLAQ
ncbi:hypothetical protein DCE79_12360 [Lysinibacillus sp. 2017]|uniref:DUF1292 domain-containing protein n=1 Tax=unclassified Lysinibacillus TaxID=2636778 RepID=UPI000D527739|nr:MULTISPECIES: DUF1292 domain-containing protein [unclassified Lysinibacillus]AWE08136.1 hypothetical protein DCE79_12360 [Lysinibacillus sp. 2017]TGN36360.1 DUF1292 domain-containing protein [Lysinibacillus sp. S2017]